MFGIDDLLLMAAIGAAAGGTTGALTNKRNPGQGALGGALIGGVGGAALGGVGGLASNAVAETAPIAGSAGTVGSALAGPPATAAGTAANSAATSALARGIAGFAAPSAAWKTGGTAAGMMPPPTPAIQGPPAPISSSGNARFLSTPGNSYNPMAINSQMMARMQPKPYPWMSDSYANLMMA